MLRCLLWNIQQLMGDRESCLTYRIQAYFSGEGDLSFGRRCARSERKARFQTGFWKQ